MVSQSQWSTAHYGNRSAEPKVHVSNYVASWHQVHNLIVSHDWNRNCNRCKNERSKIQNSSHWEHSHNINNLSNIAGWMQLYSSQSHLKNLKDMEGDWEYCNRGRGNTFASSASFHDKRTAHANVGGSSRSKQLCCVWLCREYYQWVENTWKYEGWWTGNVEKATDMERSNLVMEWSNGPGIWGINIGRPGRHRQTSSDIGGLGMSFLAMDWFTQFIHRAVSTFQDIYPLMYNNIYSVHINGFTLPLFHHEAAFHHGFKSFCWFGCACCSWQADDSIRCSSVTLTLLVFFAFSSPIRSTQFSKSIPDKIESRIRLESKNSGIAGYLLHELLRVRTAVCSLQRFCATAMLASATTMLAVSFGLGALTQIVVFEAERVPKLWACGLKGWRMLENGLEISWMSKWFQSKRIR